MEQSESRQSGSAPTPELESHSGLASSLQSVINKLAQLSVEISQDRRIHVYSKDILANAHVIGDGLISDPKHPHEHEEAESSGECEETGLFVEEDTNGDATYVDNGAPDRDEDDLMEGFQSVDVHLYGNIKWLNSLKNQIVSLRNLDVVQNYLSIPF